MISIVITGHGHFATGLLSAVELIAGPQENLAVVDFPVGSSSDELGLALKNALVSLPKEEGILFCTDLAGGTPFNQCAILSIEANGRVIAGTNLGLLLEAVSSRAFMDIETLKNTIMPAARESIKCYEDEVRELAAKKASTSSGGI